MWSARRKWVELLLVEKGSIRFDFDVFLFNVAEFCYQQNHTPWERNSQIIHRIDLTNQVHNQNILFLTINLWYWSNISYRSTHFDQRVKNACAQVCKSVKIIHIPFGKCKLRLSWKQYTVTDLGVSGSELFTKWPIFLMCNYLSQFNFVLECP